MKEIARIGFALFLVCLLAAVSLSAVNYLTRAEIEKRKEAELAESLRMVFPLAERFEELSLPLEERREGVSVLAVYKAFLDGVSQGYVFRVSSMGYGGPMVLLLGIDREEKLTGIQVLEHQETPGLGSNVAEDSFLSQFVGKSIRDPFEVKKDIVAVTGATISTNAVVRACRGTIFYLKEVAEKP